MDKYVRHRIPFRSLARQEVEEGIVDALLQLGVVVVEVVVLVAVVAVVVVE